MISAFTRLLKEVKRNVSSIIVILLTVLLAVSISAGMLSHAITFKKSAEGYFDANKMWDIKITSTLGFTKQDVIALTDADGVKKTTALISAETNTSVNSSGNYGTKIYALNFDSISANPDSEVAAPRLIKGNYPTGSNSCVAVVSNALKENIKIGDTVSFNSNIESASQVAFTVTGLVSSAEYSSFVRDSNPKNSDGTEIVIFVRDTAFLPDTPFTEINVILEGSEELDSFSRDYAIFASTASGPVKMVANEREQKRDQGLDEQYEANIEKLQKQYDYIKSEGETQVKELTSIIKEINKRTENEDKRLVGVKASLDLQKSNLDAAVGDASYFEKKEQYEKALSEYQREKENNDLNKLTAQKLENDKKSIEQSTAKKLEKAKKNLDTALKQGVEGFAQKWSLIFREENPGFKSVLNNVNHISSVFTVIPFAVIFMGIGIVVCVTYFAVKRRRGEAEMFVRVGVDIKKLRNSVIISSSCSAVAGVVLGVVFAKKIIPDALYAVIGQLYTIPFDTSKQTLSLSLIIGTIFVLITFVSVLLFLNRVLTAKQIDNGEYAQAGVFEKTPTVLRLCARNIFKRKFTFAAFAVLIALLNVCLIFASLVSHIPTGINRKQYGETVNYDYKVDLRTSSDYKTNELINDYLKDKQYFAARCESAKISFDGITDYISVVVPEDGKLSGLIKLDSELDKNGVIVTREFAKRLGIEKGSTLEVQTEQTKVTFTVSSVTKNYLGNSVYIHPELYGKTLETEIVPNTLFIKAPQNSDFSEEIVKLNNTGIVYEISKNETVNAENFSRLSDNIYYPCLILAALLIFAISGMLIFSRQRQITKAKRANYGVKTIALYFAVETAAVCVTGILLGIVAALLVTLPLGNMAFDGIYTVSTVGFLSVIKSVLISVGLTVFANAVNLTVAYIKK